MIIGSVLLRLVPHMPNFAPVTGIGLFGGAYLNKKIAILLPLTVMVISDYLLLYISPFTMSADFSRVYPITALFRADTAFVWGSFLISSLIGLWLRNHKKPALVVGATLLASVQFFLITNFGVWVVGAYSRGLDGLIQSYIMGLPFLKGTILGDLVYTSAFFGVYEFSQRVVRNTRLVFA